MGAEVKTCVPAICQDGVATLKATCDGDGGCPPPVTSPCLSYACDVDACKTSCDAGADCAPGYYCFHSECTSGAICDGDHTLITADGGSVDCRPFRCGSGHCKDPCISVTDCAAPLVCDDGGCVDRPAGEFVDEASGCAVGAAGQPCGRGMIAVIAVVAAFLRRRRLGVAGAGLAIAALAVGACAEGHAPPSTVDPTGTAAEAAVWQLASSMATPRAYPTMTPLPDGRVLVAGGYDGVLYLATAELYDPATGTWSPAAPMSTQRAQHTATLLATGQVLVAGGMNGLGSPKNAERYDPAADTWSPAGTMVNDRIEHTATLLPDGRVLVAGGFADGCCSLQAAEIYQPALDTWTPAAPLSSYRKRHTATLLGDGTVLVAGGRDASQPVPVLASATLYHPGSDTWTPAASMHAMREYHSAALLGDGRVLVAGGSTNAGFGTASAEVYAPPPSDQWTNTAGVLPFSRTHHTATRIGNGMVLLVGGDVNGGGGLLGRSTVFYDPSSSGWIAGVDTVTDRIYHAAAFLPSTSQVLVAGGQNHLTPTPTVLASAELFTPVPLGSACDDSGECAVGFCVSGRCCSTLCLDQGAASCGTDGTCDAKGACNLYAPSAACSVCAGGTLSSGHCDGAGHCLAPQVLGCGLYLTCAGPTACGTTCAGDAQCAPGAYCAAPACLPREATGQPCAGASQCQSGFCVDGVCCAGSCTDPCYACSAAASVGVDGVCAPVKSGGPPRGGQGCADEGAQSCGHDGTCDGAGACRSYADGVQCGPRVCAGDVAVDPRCAGGQCDTTSAQARQPCAPFLCQGSACTTSCAGPGDCIAGAFCNAGACQIELQQGEPCQGGGQCKTGLCVDGYCCDAPCDGECEACDRAAYEGTCLPVQGAPHGGRPACPAGTPGEPCSAAACDGAETQSCIGFVTVECRPATCAGGRATAGASCRQGTCPAVQPEDERTCEPFACGATACLGPTCQDSAECAAGYRCEAGACVPGRCDGDHTIVVAHDTPRDCSPYRCSGGSCTEPCRTVADCAAPAACDGAGRCVSRPDASSGFGCRVAAPIASPSPWIALALAGLGAIRSRSGSRRRAR